MTAASSLTPANPTFLGVLPEIRDKIYTLLLVAADDFGQTKTDAPDIHLAILGVNHQIREEAKDVFNGNKWILITSVIQLRACEVVPLNCACESACEPRNAIPGFLLDTRAMQQFISATSEQSVCFHPMI